MPHPDPLRRDPAPEPGADRDEDARTHALRQHGIEDVPVRPDAMTDEDRALVAAGLRALADGTLIPHDEAMRRVRAAIAEVRRGDR